MGQKAEARTVTLQNMEEAVAGLAMLAVPVIEQAVALCTGEAVVEEPVEITLRPKLVVHGVHIRLVAAAQVARQKL